MAYERRHAGLGCGEAGASLTDPLNGDLAVVPNGDLALHALYGFP